MCAVQRRLTTSAGGSYAEPSPLDWQAELAEEVAP
jgi:hypothetical protein